MISFIIVFIIGMTIWFVNIFSVYGNASIYKNTYDQVQKEKKYCDSIQGTSQPKEKFDYCDQFQTKFKYLDTVK